MGELAKFCKSGSNRFKKSPNEVVGCEVGCEMEGEVNRIENIDEVVGCEVVPMKDPPSKKN